MQTIRPGRRLACGLIDISVFVALTLVLASLMGWSPRIEFMQAYSEDDQAQYWGMLWLALAVVSAGSLYGHAVHGRSLGKWMLGVKSVRLDGRPLGWSGALRRLAYILVLVLLIFVPGPVAAFSLGPGSEWVSILLLNAGFVLVPLLAVWPWHADGSPVLQPLFGVRTIEAPREAIGT